MFYNLSCNVKKLFSICLECEQVTNPCVQCLGPTVEAIKVIDIRQLSSLAYRHHIFIE